MRRERNRPASRARRWVRPWQPARNLKESRGADYSTGKPVFPKSIFAVRPAYIPEPMLTNSTRLDELIQDGKLMLTFTRNIAGAGK